MLLTVGAPAAQEDMYAGACAEFEACKESATTWDQFMAALDRRHMVLAPWWGSFPPAAPAPCMHAYNSLPAGLQRQSAASCMRTCTLLPHLPCFRCSCRLAELPHVRSWRGADAGAAQRFGGAALMMGGWLSCKHAKSGAGRTRRRLKRRCARRVRARTQWAPRRCAYPWSSRRCRRGRGAS